MKKNSALPAILREKWLLYLKNHVFGLTDIFRVTDTYESVKMPDFEGTNLGKQRQSFKLFQKLVETIIIRRLLGLVYDRSLLSVKFLGL